MLNEELFLTVYIIDERQRSRRDSGRGGRFSRNRMHCMGGGRELVNELH